MNERMNERIEKLDKQAVDHALSVCDANGVYQGKEYLSVVKEKFAELIVQECVKHITDQQDLVETNWQCKDGIHIVYSLKEHFGVE